MRISDWSSDVCSSDLSENLVSDIVGELAGLIEIEEILDQSGLADVERSEERVEEALRRARESSEMQRILFQHAVSYDANELQSSFAMGLAHLRAFVFGMLTAAGGSVRDSRFYPGRAWRLELPDALVAAIPGLGRDPLVTFDRNLGAERGKVLLLDMDHPLVRHLLASARHYDFEGITGAIALDGPRHVVIGMLRWPDEQNGKAT